MSLGRAEKRAREPCPPRVGVRGEVSRPDDYTVVVDGGRIHSRPPICEYGVQVVGMTGRRGIGCQLRWRWRLPDGVSFHNLVRAIPLPPRMREVGPACGVSPANVQV